MTARDPVEHVPAELAIDTLRTLAMDAVQAANSGHPGAPMGCAAMAWTLFSRHLRFDPADPEWPDRDRFVLSNGHASMLLYGLLHLAGYDVSLDDIKAFRQWGSNTPGHPENFLTPGVETTTGPLGQGFANAIGMAIAERALADRYNVDGHTVVDHFTYVMTGDGCLMEGVASEAASLAGHLGLGRLITLYDDNQITIDGKTDISFTEDVEARFEAYGWHTVRVSDGNDVAAVDAAITEAREVTDRPSLILVQTHIGFGSPNKQDTSSAHGSPLGPEEIERTKAAYGWPTDAHFLVPDEVAAAAPAFTARGAQLNDAWQARVDALAETQPELATELRRRLSGELPAGWADELPAFEASESGIATRAASGKVLRALHDQLPELFGGSADLAGSNKTFFPDFGVFERGHQGGRNIHFGVREHAMGSVCNGMALHGGFIPFGATFLVFSDYMRPAVRLGALEQAKSIWVWTHDSIGLGEDGPTHQPVEHLAALRAIPEFLLVRPADANETREAWVLAIEDERPVGLALTRQKVPTFDRAGAGSAEGVRRGGYVLFDADGDPAPDVILIASGSEVSIAVDAHRTLTAEGVRSRVVSLPCWRRFAEQDADYRESVLPRAVTARVAIEAAATLGWERWVGWDGRIIGLDRFGASAPWDELYAHLGLHADAVVAAANDLLGRG